jgi:1-acyl-sn-glycerol-3-phosphate acyltransferase
MNERSGVTEPPPAGEPIRVGPDRVKDDPWWQIGLLTLAVLLRIFLRIRFEGLENIPESGGAILAPNHFSVLDPPVLALGPSKRGRTIRFLAAAEFFERGRHIVAWGLRRFRQIPVRRGMADWRALGEVAGVIRAGALAGIFPEGRVGEGPGLQPGHKGLARVALAAQVPVLPVAISGTAVRWPRGGIRWRRPFRPTVHIVIGRPIPVRGDPRSRQDVRDLTDRIMAEIEALLPRARAGAEGRSRG